MAFEELMLVDHPGFLVGVDRELRRLGLPKEAGEAATESAMGLLKLAVYIEQVEVAGGLEKEAAATPLAGLARRLGGQHLLKEADMEEILAGLGQWIKTPVGRAILGALIGGGLGLGAGGLAGRPGAGAGIGALLGGGLGLATVLGQPKKFNLKAELLSPEATGFSPRTAVQDLIQGIFTEWRRK